VRARLTVGDKTLNAKARVGVAPPHYAPDSLFVRNLVDDLDQALNGVQVSGDSRERALDVVRRAFETVRFMNVAVMNGNPFKGRDPLDLDTMPAEEAFGTERPLRAVFSPPAADTRAIAALHQRVYAALTSGSDTEFEDLRGRRLLTIDGRSVMTKILGPKPSDPTTPMVLIKEDNPDGVVCMEWSNNFAELVQRAGEEVTCIFSGEKWKPRRAWPKDPKDVEKLVKVNLKIRNFFEPNSRSSQRNWRIRAN
jgi:hypothetical protein